MASIVDVSFPSLAVRPVTFPHVTDVRVDRLVERLEINMGALGLRTARRAKVPGSIPHIFS